MKRLGLVLMTLVNRERSFWSLPPVQYDFQLEKYLDANVTDATWLYEDGPQTRSWTVENVTRSCSLNGCFIRPLGYHYLFRDTFRDSVPRIFRYRINQGRICKRTVFADGDPCSWFYAYYPVLMQRDLTRFACKTYNVQGRYVPVDLVDKQKRSFWCFSDVEPFYLGDSK